MCRLFGFRSVIQSQVHSSLVDAENALGIQSGSHPDGWGVAYYVENSPHVVKSAQAAVGDAIFKRVSGVVSSETVVAHIRKTTVGNNNILNTHPFQYGNWIFAHNGNITDFNDKKDELKARVSPSLRRFILGETDSELIFYFLLSHLSGKYNLGDKTIEHSLLTDTLAKAMEELIKVAGAPADKDDSGEKATYYTFILTNGKHMVGYQGGKNLFYSTYKNLCGDRDSCPSFSPECEARTKTGYINHLIFSSEPLSGENVWLPLEKGQMISVDQNMLLKISGT
ncbi:MAG: class II glutamine amidotransferase [Bacteriovoracaceae bacterium]|nr:class II glutamine amidotransferase [Bacteriovoracaceae bacterium]